MSQFKDYRIPLDLESQKGITAYQQEYFAATGQRITYGRSIAEFIKHYQDYRQQVSEGELLASEEVAELMDRTFTAMMLGFDKHNDLSLQFKWSACEIEIMQRDFILATIKFPEKLTKALKRAYVMGTVDMDVDVSTRVA